MTIFQQYQPFHVLCWISVLCINLWISSASRSALQMRQFQSKLDMFETEIDLLQHDVSDLQQHILTLNTTCLCHTSDGKQQGSPEGQDGISASAALDIHKALPAGTMAVMEQCKADFKAELTKVSDNVKMVFHDEKKHLRHNLEKIHQQQADFLQETDTRINAHEDQMKQNQDSALHEIQNILNKKEERIIQLEETITSLAENSAKVEKEKEERINKLETVEKEKEERINKFETVEKENEERINKLETTIATLADKSAEVNKDNEILKRILNVLFGSPNGIHEENCIRSTKNWVTNIQLKAQFLVVQDPMIWNDAHSYCTKNCGHLVEIDSAEKHDFVKSLLTGKTYTIYWLGMTDSETEGIWKWVHSNRLINAGYSNWGNGEPNDAGIAGEDCANAHPQNPWNDIPCHAKFAFVCERNIPFLL